MPEVILEGKYYVTNCHDGHCILSGRALKASWPLCACCGNKLRTCCGRNVELKEVKMILK
jgi:hypothetical protein